MVDERVGLEFIHERPYILERNREKHTDHICVQLQSRASQSFCNGSPQSCLVERVELSNLIVSQFADFFHGPGLPQVLSGPPPCCDNGQPLALFRHLLRKCIGRGSAGAAASVVVSSVSSPSSKSSICFLSVFVCNKEISFRISRLALIYKPTPHRRTTSVVKERAVFNTNNNIC